jgi:hypothetical protein
MLPYIESKLKELQGKNVLILDIETNGLPSKKPVFHENMSDAYYDYRENSKYDRCRIVEIAWSYIENYDKDNIDVDNIKTFIRKPVDFNEITNSQFHGISYKKAMKKGRVLSKILNKKGLASAIKNTDYIIAHNITFDTFILLNELHRIKFKKSIKKIKKMLTTNSFVCTAEFGKHICELKSPSPYAKSFKMPKLIELYSHYYKKNPMKSHRAKADVRSVLKILQKM